MSGRAPVWMPHYLLYSKFTTSYWHVDSASPLDWSRTIGMTSEDASARAKIIIKAASMEKWAYAVAYIHSFQNIQRIGADFLAITGFVACTCNNVKFQFALSSQLEKCNYKTTRADCSCNKLILRIKFANESIQQNLKRLWNAKYGDLFA